MALQHLNDLYVRAGLQKVGGEAVVKGVHRHPLLNAQELAGCSTGDPQGLWVDRAAAIAPGKQPSPRLGQSPIDAQNLQQLRDSIT